jgi:glycosyltransferase involved in cell wall biosynthesis
MISSIAHVNLAKTFRGGERQTVLLIKALNKLKPNLKQYLVCKDKAEIIKHVTDIPNLEIITVKSRLQGHFILAKKAQIINAHDAKAIHWASLHNILYKTPFIIIRRVTTKIKNNFFNRINYKKAHTIVAISKKIAESVILSFNNQISFKKPLKVIYDAYSQSIINLDKVNEIKKAYQGYTVFGHVGAYIDSTKGQKILIEAGIKFLKNYPKTKFILLGKGKDEEEFKSLTKDYPEFEWLGFKDDVNNYIKAMDIFLFPSRHEGLGSTILDAIDQNIPVIASNVGGIPEIIMHNKTGFLHENENSDDLYNQMVRLYNDKSLQNLLADNAKKEISNFSPETMAKAYYKIYEEILTTDI